MFKRSFITLSLMLTPGTDLVSIKTVYVVKQVRMATEGAARNNVSMGLAKMSGLSL